MGNDAPTQKSNYANDYDEKSPLEVDKSNFQDPYKNSFTVKHYPFSGPNDYESEYKESTSGPLAPQNIKPAGVSGKRDGKGDYQSNIDLGHGEGPGISEHADK